MDYDNFREKIYYINLKDILVFIAFVLIGMMLLGEVSFFYKNISSDLISLSGIIIIMILFTFSIHIKSIMNREIYGLIQIFLLINFIVILVFLSPVGQFNQLKILFNNIGYEFRFTNIVIMYYLIAKYRRDEVNSKKVYIEYIFFLFIIVAQIYLFKIYPSLGLYLFKLIFDFLILIFSYKNIYIYNFDSKGKVDLLKLNLIFASIRFVFMIISNIKILSVFNTVSSLLMNVVLVSTMLVVISNIIKENYNFLFEETRMTNEYLERINRKIIKSNYNLEEIYKKLRDKQMLYKSFLGGLNEPIVIINNNLRISYCNVKFLNEVGKENIRKVVNRRIERYINFDNEFHKEICFNINGGPNTTTINLNEKKFEVRFFRLNNEDSEFILVFKDITEENKLYDMREELEGIRIREDIKKNFLANISHDIKIPVNVIYSAIQLEKILIENKDIEKIKFYNEISKENCVILTRFTNNLIDISKIDYENLEVNLVLGNIVEFIEDYLLSLSPYIRNSKLDIIFDTSEEEIYIYYDKEMMQRIVLNLVSNSIKFTSPGGVIFVKIKDFKDYVLINIGDNGIGMSKEFISKAFNKYEMENRRNKENISGFGVGLFVVYNLVKAQNGDIEIQSEINKGTNFVIKLYK